MEEWQIVEKEFRGMVLARLDESRVRLKAVLSKIIGCSFPEAVKTLEFVVFSETLNRRFSIAVWLLDDKGSQVELPKEDQLKRELPGWPHLLPGTQVYSDAVFREFYSRDQDLEQVEVSIEVLMPWFVSCWKEAGGERFPLEATFSRHDQGPTIDLKTGEAHV
jgi:hypothetical protein